MAKGPKSKVFDKKYIFEYYNLLIASKNKSRNTNLRPKIGLFDFGVKDLESIELDEYNVSYQLFSPVPHTEMDLGYGIPIQPNLTNMEELEVLFINLEGLVLDKEEYNSIYSSAEKLDNRGYVDPRSIVMESCRQSFDKIIKNGGMFVIFCEPRKSYTIYDRNNSRFDYDIWSFLSIFSVSVNLSRIDGEECEVLNSVESITRSIKKLINNNNPYFSTKINYPSRDEDNFTPLIKNKYGEIVGGLISFNLHKGKVLLLPKFQNYPDVVKTLLDEVLSELSPHLFPNAKALSWLKNPNYRLPPILKLENDIKELKKNYSEELNQLKNQIKLEEQEYSFLFKILYETDDPLVYSVKESLEFIGFQNIVLVDQEIMDDHVQNKQEDLQIRDREPFLIIEIKGISSIPTESDTNQVLKYVTRRSKEFTEELLGMTIVNHQKNIEPSHRHKIGFTEPQIEDAKDTQVLLTTYEIFRIAKAKENWNWNFENIRPFFYNTNKEEFIPQNYKRIGKIFNFLSKNEIVGVEVTEYNIRRNDRVGFIIDSEFYESNIESLEFENHSIEETNIGQKVGLKIEDSNFLSSKIINKFLYVVLIIN